MAFSICYLANYAQGKTKLSQKSENAVADDRVLKFLYDADLCHVESSVRCHRKYKNHHHHHHVRIAGEGRCITPEPWLRRMADLHNVVGMLPVSFRT